MASVEDRQALNLVAKRAVALLMLAVHVRRDAATNGDGWVAGLNGEIEPSRARKIENGAETRPRLYFDSAGRGVEVQDAIEGRVID